MKKLTLFSLFGLILMNCANLVGYTGTPISGISIDGLPHNFYVKITIGDEPTRMIDAKVYQAKIEKSEGEFINKEIFGDRVNPLIIAYEYTFNEKIIDANINAKIYGNKNGNSLYKWSLRNIRFFNDYTNKVINFNDFRSNVSLPYIFFTNIEDGKFNFICPAGDNPQILANNVTSTQGILTGGFQLIYFIDESNHKIGYISRDGIFINEGFEQYQDRIVPIAINVLVLREMIPGIISFMEFD